MLAFSLRLNQMRHQVVAGLTAFFFHQFADLLHVLCHQLQALKLRLFVNHRVEGHHDGVSEAFEMPLPLTIGSDAQHAADDRYWEPGSDVRNEVALARAAHGRKELVNDSAHQWLDASDGSTAECGHCEFSDSGVLGTVHLQEAGVAQAHRGMVARFGRRGRVVR